MQRTGVQALSSLPCASHRPAHSLLISQSATDNFGQVVRELKQRCGVDYVYCWHAMMGYWSGLMPGVRLTSRGHDCCHDSLPAGPAIRHVMVCSFNKASQPALPITALCLSLPALKQAPGVAKYTPRLMYPRPSPGTLEVDPSMQVGRVTQGTVPGCCLGSNGD